MAGDQLHVSFFGLREQPFAPTADPSYFFATREHKECLFRLWSGIDARQGIAVVLGNYGTGKTALLRKLLTGMAARRATYHTAVIASPIPSWTSFALLEAILLQFGVRSPERSFAACMEAFHGHLQSNLDRISTLIIDDAQNLSERSQLELLRLVQNLETPQHKLLNLVLLAQLEWTNVLQAAPNFMQRINMTYTLGPISLEETHRLIEFRIQQAGGEEDRAPVFEDGAVRAIHAYAEGNPRVTVTICRNALLTAQQVRQRVISAEIIAHTIEKTTLPVHGIEGRGAGLAYETQTMGERQNTADPCERLENVLPGGGALQGRMTATSAAAGEEKARVTEDLRVLREKTSALEARIGTLQAQVVHDTEEVRRRVSEEIKQFQSQLDTSREQTAQAREETHAMVRLAETFIGNATTEREFVARLEAEQAGGLREIERLQEQLQRVTLRASETDASARRLESALEGVKAKFDAVHRRVSHLEDERKALAIVFESARMMEKSLRGKIEEAERQVPVGVISDAAPPVPEDAETANSLEEEPAVVVGLEQKPTVEDIGTVEEETPEREMTAEGIETAEDDTSLPISSLADMDVPIPGSGIEVAPRAADTSAKATEGPSAASVSSASRTEAGSEKSQVPGRFRRSLGEMMVERGHITTDQLQRALQTQRLVRRQKIGRILIDDGHASDETVLQALASQLRLPFLRLCDLPISMDAARLCNARLARQYNCLPIHVKGNQLTLAMCEPTDLVAIDEVERATKLHVNVVVATKADIDQAQAQCYGT